MKKELLLEVKDLFVQYDGISALKGISFEVHQGEIVSLIGANGAGKSTTLRALSGLVKVKAGEIRFLNDSLNDVPAFKRVELGLVHSPEGRGVFAQMSVRENLEMGAYVIKNKSLIADDMDYCFSLFPRLKERIKQLAGTLSGGEQQMLAMARALMARPKLLLLDEPSLGLAPLIVAQIFATIKELNQKGMSILLVEQNAKGALKISDRSYVLETGKIVLAGKSSELLTNSDVQKSYLGI